MVPSFQEAGIQVIAASCDSHFTHAEWTRKERKKGGLGDMNMPMVADISQEIAKSYGCLITEGPDAGIPMRATYIIDDKGIVRHIQMNDLPVGRNVEEILRLTQAFQFHDKNPDYVMPCSWKPGAKVMKADHNAAETKDFFAG